MKHSWSAPVRFEHRTEQPEPTRGLIDRCEPGWRLLEGGVDGRAMPKLRHQRVSLAGANAFVALHHRHHKPVVGHLFSLATCLGSEIVGVAIVGCPVSRMRDDGLTAEVTRLCTDGTQNACSFLYGACARASFALGFERIGTYILASEPGTSLTAAGWRCLGERGGGSWSCPSRPRIDVNPTQGKLLFERHAGRNGQAGHPMLASAAPACAAAGSGVAWKGGAGSLPARPAPDSDGRGFHAKR